jgi:hypothetical protein
MVSFYWGIIMDIIGGIIGGMAGLLLGIYIIYLFSDD